MKNSARDYLNKHDRSNLFFVLRGDKPQQETGGETQHHG